MAQPRFELFCSEGTTSRREFVLKNVSSVMVSKMVPLSFVLIHVDHTQDNLLPFSLQFPTSLAPGQECCFEIDSSKLKHRNVGDKEFKFSFSVEDDNSNVYHCIAEKNVEESRNKSFIAGKWDVSVSLSRHDYTIEQPELFKNLLSKDVYAILDGDIKYGSFMSRNGRQFDIALPYLSGPVLCDISTRFGLPAEYHWEGSNFSRWYYVEAIMKHCIEEKTISTLFVFLFSKSQFSKALNGLDLDEADEIYKKSVKAAVDDINRKIQFSGSQLVYENKQFLVIRSNKLPV